MREHSLPKLTPIPDTCSRETYDYGQGHNYDDNYMPSGKKPWAWLMVVATAIALLLIALVASHLQHTTHTLTGHIAPVAGIAMTQNGVDRQTIVASAGDGTINIWTTQQHRYIYTRTLHSHTDLDPRCRPHTRWANPRIRIVEPHHQTVVLA